MAPLPLFSVDDAPDDLSYEIKRYTDWDWDQAASISKLESDWQWNAEADTTEGGSIPCGTIISVRDGVEITAEHSFSYFQINGCEFPDWNITQLWNTRQNVGTAHMLWASRGWAPWYFSAQRLGLL